MDEDTEILFELIKKKHHLNSEGALKLAIQQYYVYGDMNQKILEYLKLLVKTNRELSEYKSEEDMRMVVENESRYNRFIEEKISDANKKF